MKIPLTSLTADDNYFEDYEVGAVYRHARGKTVEPLENVLFTNLVMNTAAGHFDEHVMQSHPAKKRIVYGGVTIGLVIGLAMQDTGENAVQELGLTGIRLTKSVFHGDTLYALSEVLEKKDSDREDAGEVFFRHYGVNQKDEQVFQGERRVLIKKRCWWGDPQRQDTSWHD
ncbi:Acyl dehydratase [Rhizobiales bacterium GAS191]|nr:Acyl dehydratase [Rhizobiales bacterium GAS191]